MRMIPRKFVGKGYFSSICFLEALKDCSVSECLQRKNPCCCISFNERTHVAVSLSVSSAALC